MSQCVIRAWRLSKARYSGDLTGQGAARDGQRSNQPGQQAVYLGLTTEITVLEVPVLGLTFKENCPDLLNTRVVDVVQALRRYGIELVLVDPWVDPAEAEREHGLTVWREMPDGQRSTAVVAAVAHHEFTAQSAEQWRQLLAPSVVLLDIKSIVPRGLGGLRLEDQQRNDNPSSTSQPCTSSQSTNYANSAIQAGTSCGAPRLAAFRDSRSHYSTT